MRDEDQAGQLKAGKGTRIPVTGGILRKLADALGQAAEVYDTANDPGEFMQLIELDDESNTKYTRGQKTYAAHNKFLRIVTGAGEEFRMTFSLNDQHQFTLDFRGWWGG